MNKEEFIKITERYLDSLEAKALQSDTYFMERNKLYIENKELKEEVKEYEYIFNTMHQRELINKFDKEYSKEAVKKAKQEGRQIAGAYPDAEEVYKRYYDQKDRIDKANKEIKELYELYKDDNCYTIGDKLENVLIILKGDKE